jgi:hypothetical protein
MFGTVAYAFVDWRLVVLVAVLLVVLLLAVLGWRR